ncbi:MAG TPA: DUF1343 domain-containing protein [Anaeromyxobacteraceae bacterium]|nr:DUF1343 domain-containing protein [Anaeromyxobacteraceae bacterium]
MGLVCNPTSVDARLRHAADLLAAAPGVTLAALFGPEHGVRGDAQYMRSVGTERDPVTGVPTFSLYGETADSLRPAPAQLEGLDLLVFDVQDVGARYYTYQATMQLCMEAAAAAGVAFMVLDRPNPIGGVAVEGPALRPGFESFCGLHDLAVRHGMTVGELARLFRAERRLDLALEVIACEGWRRGMPFRETGLPWVIPSPNMPTPETALVYPGMCLLEGTNLSEGRGTTLPFELFGAPWLDARRLAEALASDRLPGVRFRPTSFVPTWDKHAGVRCHGVQLHVVDPAAFRPFRTGLACVARAREQAPRAFQWRTAPYEFVEGIPAFDLLCGSDRERAAIDAGAAPGALFAHLGAEERAFSRRRSAYLAYPR